EHRESAHAVRVREADTHFGKVLPDFSPGRLVPGSQRLLGSRVQLPELPQPLPGNHVHEVSSSQTAKPSRGVAWRASRKDNSSHCQPDGRTWREDPAALSSAGTVSICPDPSPERWTVAFCVSDGALKALIRSDAV